MNDSPEDEGFFSCPEFRKQYRGEIAPSYKPVIEWALRSVADEKPVSILDLGCGLGCSTEILRDTFTEAKIHAIDSCKDAIDAFPKFRSVKYHCGTFESLRQRDEFKNDSIDLLLASIVTYEQDNQEFDGECKNLYSTLADNCLDALKVNGIGVFVHSGPESERFLSATDLLHCENWQKTLRPRKAEWKVLEGVEYGYVIVRALENDFHS